VLRAEVEERPDGLSLIRDDEGGVTLRHVVGEREVREEKRDRDDRDEGERGGRLQPV